MSPATAIATPPLRGELTCTHGSHELRVHVRDGRMRLDAARLATLAAVARAARVLGGLRGLVERLPVREVELALRGHVIARRLGQGRPGWRVHPLGLLRALGTRA